ncbi:hypothetical protein [Halalkalibacter wakoensis]|uniref:hypothetical protein n=1 Tax=Halalkalibacter wakoensis TaxID=127891 RepID=UPI0012E2A4F7|nr:hypothetical protein [Halalkalibacter wakoensis]
MIKKVVVLLSFVLLLGACHQQTVDEEEVFSVYNEFLLHIHELFAYHTYEEESYFNERYHSEDELREFLGSFMTEDGIEQLLEDIYVQQDGRYVYRDHFQSLLKDDDLSYYEVTKQTVFNPGLRMVMVDDLHIYESDGTVEMKADQVPVQFYSEESSYGKSQFGDLGYPAVDYVSVHVALVKDNEEYLISRFEVKS